jgi:HlyD family secretion protein
MDKKIEPKKGLKKRHFYYAFGIAFFMFLIYQMVFAEKLSVYRVETDKITIEEVKHGVFHNYITVTGNIEPGAKIYL